MDKMRYFQEKLSLHELFLDRDKQWSSYTMQDKIKAKLGRRRAYNKRQSPAFRKVSIHRHLQMQEPVNMQKSGQNNLLN